MKLMASPFSRRQTYRERLAQVLLDIPLPTEQVEKLRNLTDDELTVVVQMVHETWRKAGMFALANAIDILEEGGPAASPTERIRTYLESWKEFRQTLPEPDPVIGYTIARINRIPKEIDDALVKLYISIPTSEGGCQMHTLLMPTTDWQRLEAALGTKLNGAEEAHMLIQILRQNPWNRRILSVALPDRGRWLDVEIEGKYRPVLAPEDDTDFTVTDIHLNVPTHEVGEYIRRMKLGPTPDEAGTFGLG